MWLLTSENDGTVSLIERSGDDIPHYAILSHTWGQGEVTFEDIREHTGQDKAGYHKIRFCAEQATKDGLRYFWVDTCCINKTNSVELNEALTSMFNWYKSATRCYVYLSDVSTGSYTHGCAELQQSTWNIAFRRSRYFTRGWTLSELLAPSSVEFFSSEGERLGDKRSLEPLIHEVTGIATLALQGKAPSEFSVDERMKWAANRNTTKLEDKAYCLLGIFGIFMLPNYGEGANAFTRLRKKIDRAEGTEGNRSSSNFKLFSIPFSLEGVPLVNRFVDRASEMAGLEQCLLPTRQTKRREVAVLNGLGGIGKTQLSIEFARKHQVRFSAVIWIDGRSEDRLKQSIAAIAKSIPEGQIPESSRKHSPHSTSDADAVIQDVIDWLSSPGNNGWLIIFDNVDQDYRDSDATSDAYDVKRYFPRADHGSILITTRLVGLGQLGTSLQVSRVDHGQALAIFKNGYGVEFEESKESKSLLDLLDGLPLALAQASAFMRETATSFHEYITFYKGQWRELMESEDGSQGPLQEYENGSVWTTWTISYRAIQRRDKTAANLLLLWACQDNKDLWFELLVPAYESLTTADCVPDWFQTVASSKLTFTQTVKLLHGYSLIEGIEGLSSYATHPVVHEWAWQMQDEEARKRNCWLAAIVIEAAVPLKPTKDLWTIQRRLLPHADRYMRCSSESTARSNIEGHLNKRCLMLDSLNGLGNLYADQRKLSEAEKMYQRALQGYEEALGAEHPSTLGTINNLGHLYTRQDKLDKSEKMLQRALQGYEKIFGAEHPSTLSTINNLGNLYLRQDKIGEAKKTCEQALQGFENTLGADHTSTLITVNNLGNIYKDQGKLSEAEEMLQRVLQGREKILGAEHTSTLSTMNHLGDLYAHQNKLGEAEKMLLGALQGFEKTLGEEHPWTLGTINHLGILYMRQGKLDKAEKMYQRALQGFEKALGEEHPWSLGMTGNVGNLYIRQGKLSEAKKMFQRALQGFGKALRTDNIVTFISALNTVYNLGSLLAAPRNFNGSRVMYAGALLDYEKVHGHEHDECRNALATLSALDTTITEAYLSADVEADQRHEQSPASLTSDVQLRGRQVSL